MGHGILIYERSTNSKKPILANATHPWRKRVRKAAKF